MIITREDRAEKLLLQFLSPVKGLISSIARLSRPGLIHLIKKISTCLGLQSGSSLFEVLLDLGKIETFVAE